jgi:hypothetical protein
MALLFAQGTAGSLLFFPTLRCDAHACVWYRGKDPETNKLMMGM